MQINSLSMAKIRSYSLSALILLFMISVYSCLNSVSGEGELTYATRNTGSFTSIQLDLDASVYITDSLETSFMISAQENLMNVIETKLKDDKLIIYSDKYIHNSKPVTIYISASRLTEISLNGSGSIISENTLKAGNITLEMSGSGMMKIAVVCDKLNASVSGSGKMEISGSSHEADIEISGSGIIDASRHATGNCNADISGSCKALVFSSGILKASVSGSGNILYRGAPAEVIPSVSGSGSIEKME